MLLQPVGLGRLGLGPAHRPLAALVEPQRRGGEAEQHEQPGADRAEQQQRHGQLGGAEHGHHPGPEAVHDAPGGPGHDHRAVQEVAALKVFDPVQRGDVLVHGRAQVQQRDLVDDQALDVAAEVRGHRRHRVRHGGAERGGHRRAGPALGAGVDRRAQAQRRGRHHRDRRALGEQQREGQARHPPHRHPQQFAVQGEVAASGVPRLGGGFGLGHAGCHGAPSSCSGSTRSS